MSFKNKRLPVLLWLGLVLAGLLVVWRAHYVADMSAFLPAQPSATQDILIEQLTHGTLSRTLLIGIEGAPPETLAQVSKKLAAAMRDSQRFSTVQNGDAEASRAEQALIFNNRYLLSPTTAAHMNEAGMHAAIGNSIDLLASPLGLLVKQIFPQDPTGELVEIMQGFGVGERMQTAHGVWMAADGQRALLLAQTAAAGTDTDQQEAMLAFIDAQFAALKQSADAPDLKLKMSGSPVFSVHARATIKTQVLVFSLLGLAAISALYLLVFRRPQLFVLGALPILSAILAGVVSVSLCFGTVHALTIGFGASLVGEAVDYSIYYFAQAQKTSVDRQQRFWAAIRLGLLTSIVGFVALLVSDFPGLAQLSLFSVAGLIAAGLVTRFVLPGLHGTLPNSNALDTLGRWIVVRRPLLYRRRFIGYGVALLMLCVLLSGRANWSDQLADLSPLPTADKAIDAELRADMGVGVASTRHLIVVSGPTREAALQGSERVSALLATLQAQKRLAGFDAPSRLLPSLQMQRARLAAIPDPAQLQARLNNAVHGLPVKAATLAPFVAAASAAKTAPLLDATAFNGSSFHELIQSLLYPVDNAWVALIVLRDTPEVPLNAAPIIAALHDSGIAGAQYIDLLAESNRLYGQYLNGTLHSAGLGLLAIVVLLCVALRSFRAALAVITPLLLAVVVVLGGLALAGVTLTLLHVVGLLLVVAIGSNYVLLARANHARNDPTTLASLVIACIATLFGFGVLAFTDVPVLRAIGQTVGPGAILSLLFALGLMQTTPAAEDQS